MQFTDAVSDLLALNRIPTLDAGQMSDFSRYLFTVSNRTERIQVAEGRFSILTQLRGRWGLTDVQSIPVCAKRESISVTPSMQMENCF